MPFTIFNSLVTRGGDTPLFICDNRVNKPGMTITFCTSHRCHQKTRCSSKSHDPGRQCTRFFKLCGKQVPRQLVDFLIEIGDIRAHSTYLCQNCKDDAAIKFECSKNTDPSSEPTSCLGETSGASYGEPAAKKRALKMRDFTNDIIEEIDGGYFSIEDLQRIATAKQMCLGHIEINMVKAIVKFLWEPAFIDLARMLGFNSIRALQCCQNCSDHHKSWQMVQIFLHAMGQELLLPYVQKVILEGGSPFPAGYYHWLQGVQNPNYNFMKEVVFSYCLAIHVFRAGVRRNNTEAVNIVKTKFSSLFSGLNMPFYMEIITRDSLVRLQCPPDVIGFLGDHESYSVSGNDSKGEGGDFVLEGKNRKTKMFIPAGLPDNNKWLQVCRNVDKLEKVNK
ncbi:Hypothetical predicted protein [Mytilus galloprovincialis]|uniref:Uncharacterized protein n=1 Tax=Mytilus galloprovincialis TaxID=29158 RepID=A0A8B6D1C9_MYTGA|nr:Hypothetical predicted protein [Mytilus galloprovincialis]